MRQKTILLYALTLSFLVLLFICGLVYHKGYTTLTDRTLSTGFIIADHLAEHLLENVKSMEKYVKTFMLNNKINRSKSTADIIDRVSIRDARNAFVSGFETEFSYQLFDRVDFVDPHGMTLVSTEGGDMDYNSAPWWPKLIQTGRIYSIQTGPHTGETLVYAQTIVNTKGSLVGACIATVYMHALVRDIGMAVGGSAFKSMELISSEGRLLYSTILHKPFADMSDTIVFHKFKEGNDWFVHTPKRGTKELAVLRQHKHDMPPFHWVLAVHMDYDKLFGPLRSMQRWLAAGFVALLLSGLFFFYLVKLIAQRNAQQRELVRNQKILHQILEGIEAAILFINPHTQTISWANKVTEKILGEPLDAIIGEKCHHFLCEPDEKPDQDPPCQISSPIFQQKFQLKRKDGAILTATKTVMKVLNGAESVIVAILFDITDRINVERQLAHVNKLESIGSLAAGIAHEINTPTQYIGDNLHFLRQAIGDLQRLLGNCKKWCLSALRQCPTPEAVEETAELNKALDLEYLLEEIPLAIQQSLDGVGRISNIVGAMKHFSHPGADSMQLGDINNALTSTSLVCRNEWKYKADLHYDLDPDLPPVLCFVNDINQVFLNVLINSAHAVCEKYADSAEKGTITLKNSQRRR